LIHFYKRKSDPDLRILKWVTVMMIENSKEETSFIQSDVVMMEERDLEEGSGEKQDQGPLLDMEEEGDLGEDLCMEVILEEIDTLLREEEEEDTKCLPHPRG